MLSPELTPAERDVARLHWCMLEVLANEACTGTWPYSPMRLVKGDQMVDCLFREFVRHDPRFTLRGMTWSAQAQEVEYQGRIGVDAVALFLGVEKAIAKRILTLDYVEPYKGRYAIRNHARAAERDCGVAVPSAFWEGFPRQLLEMEVVSGKVED